MSGGTISGNKASNEGGGIYIDNGGTLTMTGGTVESNTASKYDGGGIMFDNATGTISNALIKGNTSTNFGGGIQVENSSNVTIENTQITENTTYGGGGVYTYDAGVFLNLSNGNITGNTAIAEAGGISCKTDEITIKGGIQITGNKLKSETEEIENNVYLRNNTTLKVEEPWGESDEGIIDAQIGISVEDGYSYVVSANDNDYSSYFIPDSAGERVYYDNSDKIVKIFGIYTVTFVLGNGEIYDIVDIPRNTAVSESPAPTPAGCYFGDWYNGDTPYDFTQPVSGNLTLTAKWLEEGKFGMSITPSKIYIVTDKPNTTAYGAAHKDGK